MARICFVTDMFDGVDAARSDRSLYRHLWLLVDEDVDYLRSNPGAPLLYESGVRYQEEPPGAEDWQNVPITLELGWGDCEDLACWRVAELIVRGIAASPFVTRQELEDGRSLYHVMVRLPDGRVEDPSRQLGMQ